MMAVAAFAAVPKRSAVRVRRGRTGSLPCWVADSNKKAARSGLNC
jgi:hypothetical protein